MSRARQPSAGQQQGPFRILMLTALPKDQPPLRLDIELRSITNVIFDLCRDPARFTTEQWQACRREELFRATTGFDPHIILFSGHGCKDGIILQDDRRRSDLMRKEDLACWFATIPSLKLVILNACKTEDTARYVAEAVGRAIGTTCKILDSVAMAFSREFFAALKGANMDQINAFDGCFRKAELATRMECKKIPPVVSFTADWHRQWKPEWYEGICDTVHYIKPDRVDQDGIPDWHCEEILRSTCNKSKVWYIARWRGFATVQEAFHEEDFRGSIELLREYHMQHPDAPGPSRRVQRWLNEA